jgi:hypothetical protein
VRNDLVEIEEQQNNEQAELDSFELDNELLFDTFAVNKSNEENLKCFLSISPSYLIEKDGMNAACLNYYKCSKLVDGFIEKE